MRVYVLGQGQYSDFSVVGVFTDKERAEALAGPLTEAPCGDGCYWGTVGSVEVFELDDPTVMQVLSISQSWEKGRGVDDAIVPMRWSGEPSENVSLEQTDGRTTHKRHVLPWVDNDQYAPSISLEVRGADFEGVRKTWSEQAAQVLARWDVLMEAQRESNRLAREAYEASKGTP